MVDSSTPTPGLDGRHVRLRALRPADHEWLYGLSTDPRVGYQWRFRPGTLRTDAFLQSLWQDVLAQLVVEHIDGKAVGLVSCYQVDFSNGFAHLAALFDPGVHRLGWPLEGVALFVRYLFQTWPLRKVYLEVLEYNMWQYSTLIGKYAQVEGRLVDHVFLDDRYWDLSTLALYKEDVGPAIEALGL